MTLQFGGSDQWGNLTGGVELIRRADGGKAHAFATPLITKADGTKYGKTEGGALWLDPEMMSPYAFHQFWLNAEDEKVGELLRIFTFLPREEIEALEAQTKPRSRSCATARRRSPSEVTTLVHGAEETAQAKAAAAALFGGGDLAALSSATLARRAARGRPRRRRLRPACPASSTCSSRPAWRKSKGEARRTVAEGGAYLNNLAGRGRRPVPSSSDLVAGSWLVLQAREEALRRRGGG